MFSKLFLIELWLKHKITVNLKDQLIGELGITVVHGSVETETQLLNHGEMLIKNSSPSITTLHEITQVLMCGREHLPGKRFIMWNFVSYNS